VTASELIPFIGDWLRDSGYGRADLEDFALRVLGVQTNLAASMLYHWASTEHGSKGD
jgi:hypothetical protein